MVVVICVIAVRLRHCNASEPTASVSLVGFTSMDIVRTYVLHVPKNETRRYRLNAGSKRNETENGNKTGTIFLNVPYSTCVFCYA